MVGKTVSYAGEVAYDHYKTNQQRSVLSTFFDLASQDEQRRPVLESGELSEVLNFQNRETYLFDEDGRVDMVDKKEECKEIKAGKELAKAIKDQIALLQKGLDDKKDNLDRLITEAMRANNGSERRFDDALQRLEMRTTDIMTVRTALERLLPLLKDPVTNAAAIQAIVVALSGLLTAVG